MDKNKECVLWPAVCYECGAEFNRIDAEQYVYKRAFRKNGKNHLVYFCSWSCLRKWDSENETGRKKGYD